MTDRMKGLHNIPPHHMVHVNLYLLLKGHTQILMLFDFLETVKGERGHRGEYPIK